MDRLQRQGRNSSIFCYCDAADKRVADKKLPVALPLMAIGNTQLREIQRRHGNARANQLSPSGTVDLLVIFLDNERQGIVADNS